MGIKGMGLDEEVIALEVTSLCSLFSDLICAVGGGTASNWKVGV